MCLVGLFSENKAILEENGLRPSRMRFGRKCVVKRDIVYVPREHEQVKVSKTHKNRRLSVEGAHFEKFVE